MISSDVVRGYIDTMILFVLFHGESYGYEISKRIREISQEEYIIKETTLYSAFARMEKIGLIESFPGDVTHGKPRTYYRITPSGQHYYREKCAEWETMKQVMSGFIKEEYISGNN